MKNIITVVIVLFSLFTITNRSYSQTSTHFIPKGNPTEAMNIILYEAKINGIDMVAGDEVGIFDGNTCVGAFVLTRSLGSLKDALFENIKAYKAEEGTTNGFITGHDISYRIWDKSEQLEITTLAASCFNQQGELVNCPKFEAGGSVFVALYAHTFCILSVSQTNLSVSSPAASTTVNLSFSGCSVQSWSVSDNASWLSVSPASGSGNGVLTLSYEGNATCTERTATVTITSEGATGSPKTITVIQGGAGSLPGIPGVISGATSLCQGSSQTYSIAAVAGATSYFWTLPGGWTGSSTSTSITAVAGPNSGAISVRAVNNCGDGVERKLNVAVTKLVEQPGVITGSTAPCLGSSQTYSVPAIADATAYTWTLPAGWTGSSTTNSITTLVGSTGGTISVKATNSCGSGPERTLNVTVTKLPDQTGAISGTTVPCQGSSQTYSVAVVAGVVTYAWTLPTGWTGSSTSNSITTTVGSTGGILSVKAVNSCGSGPESTLNMTVTALPGQSGPISGNPTPGVGSTQTYTVDAVPGATSYTWTLPAGWTGSSTTNAITTTVGSGTGYISVTANNSCGSGPVRILNTGLTATIAVVQGTGNVSPFKGTSVKITGTVSAVVAGAGYFMQDAVAPWSGIWVTDSKTVITEGSGVSVEGAVQEVNNITTLVASVVQFTTAPVQVTPLLLSSPNTVKSEQYESVLVKVKGVRFPGPQNPDGSWLVRTTETEQLLVDKLMFPYTPVAGHYYDVTGIVNGINDLYKLEPRKQADVTDLSISTASADLKTLQPSVYPNPFRDVLIIRNSENVERAILVNMKGQMIMELSHPEAILNTSQLVSGMYIVNLYSGDGQVNSFRVVKK